MYEIVLDGELAADFVDASLPFERRNSQGATILSVPTLYRDALAIFDRAPDPNALEIAVVYNDLGASYAQRGMPRAR